MATVNTYHNNFRGTQPFSNACFQIALQTNTSETFTVPGASDEKYQLLFSYNCTSNVFVGQGAVPTVPAAGSVGTETYNEFKPAKRQVKGGSVIYLITPDSGTTYVGCSLMKLPS